MAWYDEASFYHIYPLGLTGAPKQNSYGEPEHRLNTLIPWISHIKSLNCNAIYIGPLFESVGHGYETTDYKKLDSRLGTNEDLTNFVKECHAQGIRVILDGVFNHTGRDFFAFQDIKKNRENSPYKDWYCNVNFWGNNEYNDGFSYDNWGGYNLLVKLNQHNPAVRDYICDVIRFWVSEFDIDGIRLDAADVLDFGYMQALRQVANSVKPDFWLMGEVIHGDYNRWVNEGTLHSVTNYHLHKALYSGHNDHNYFEIAHTVKRLYGMGGNRPDGLKLYNFVDNHDVERIYTKLSNKAHFAPVHVLLYTLPGVPSLYYGSEFGIEGRKERGSDDSLRPALSLSDFKDALTLNPCTKLISALGRIRKQSKALSYGSYNELMLTNRQYAFSRVLDNENVVVTVNNDDSDYVMNLPAGNCAEYIGGLSGERVSVNDGRIVVNVKANSGEIWLPYNGQSTTSDDSTSNSTTEEERAYESANEFAKDMIDSIASIITTGAGLVSEIITEVAEVAKTMSEAAEEAAKEAEETEKTSERSEETTKESENTSEGTVQEPANEANDTPIAEPVRFMPEPPVTMTFSQAELDAAFEKGKIAGLQEAILAIMSKNGPVTDQMRNDVLNNIYHDSLINWVKSFR